MYPKGRRRLVGQPLLYAISIFASLGVFLFGYDQGVMSGIITGPYFLDYFGMPTSIQVGTMVAVLEIGAFATSIAAGRIGDMIGRKGTLFVGALIFTIGGSIQTFTVGFWSMVLGRVVSGFGVGLLSTIVPIYQSEISPPDHRGALACAEFTGNIVGYAVSVWTDYFCSFINSNLSWRIPLFIQCVIGSILAIGSLVMPESPRWLIDTSKDEAGMRVIADLHGGNLDNPKAKLEFQEIKDKVNQERETGEERTYKVMWKKYKQRVLLAMSSQAFAQLNGINVISYYAPRVFEEAGWKGRDAILMTGINSIVYVLSTLPPWILVDRWGRRPILLSGATVMGLALFATGYYIYLDKTWTPNAVVASVIVFNAAFGYSWGPIPWLYPPEIMPLTVRAKGVSLSTATNWGFNWIVGEMTPWLQDIIEWRLYFIHGFFCVCSFGLVYFVYPETKGIPLEEMDVVFGEEPFKDQIHIPLRSSSSSESFELTSLHPRSTSHYVSNSISPQSQSRSLTNPSSGPDPETETEAEIMKNPSGQNQNQSWFSKIFKSSNGSGSRSKMQYEIGSRRRLSRDGNGDEEELVRLRRDDDYSSEDEDENGEDDDDDDDGGGDKYPRDGNSGRGYGDVEDGSRHAEEGEDVGFEVVERERSTSSRS